MDTKRNYFLRYSNFVFLIAIFCIALFFNNDSYAEALEGKLYSKVGRSSNCDLLDYYMERDGNDLRFNFNDRKLRYVNTIDLSKIEHFSLLERSCAKARGARRLLRKRTLSDISGYNHCFNIQEKRKKAVTLCVHDRQFSTIYKSLVISIGRLNPRFRDELKPHKTLARFFNTYRKFSDAIFRLPSEDAQAGTRPALMSGEKYPNVKYKMGRRIGVGGMGMVFDAFKQLPEAEREAAESAETREAGGDGQAANKPIAGFVYKMSFLRADSGDPLLGAIGLVREAKIFALLGRHRGILSMQDAMTYSTELGIIMEKGGRDLKFHQMDLATPKYTNPRDLKRITWQLLNGLQHMHRKGVYHFDIKPENTLVKTVGTRPVLKIIDFGLSRSKALDHADLFYLLDKEGTPLYHSPERVTKEIEKCEDDKCMELQDAYAAGMLIFDALIGPNIDQKRPMRMNDQVKRENRLFYADLFNPPPFKRAIRDKGLLSLYEIALDLTAENINERMTISRAIAKLRSGR